MIALRSRKGVAAIEFALVLPLLIVFVFGIIEFGLLMYNQQIITNASREGARAGIVAASPRFPGNGVSCASLPAGSIECVVTNYAKTHMITFGAPNDPVTTVTPAYNASAPFSQNLQVVVTYNYGFLVFANFVSIGGPTKTLSATTVMRYE